MKTAKMINVWLLLDSKMPVGPNPGCLPGFFWWASSSRHWFFSDTRICFESQHRSKMSEQRIVAAPVPAILHTITRGIKRIPQFWQGRRWYSTLQWVSSPCSCWDWKGTIRMVGCLPRHYFAMLGFHRCHVPAWVIAELEKVLYQLNFDTANRGPTSGKPIVSQLEFVALSHLV